MPSRNRPAIPQRPGPYRYGLNPGMALNIYTRTRPLPTRQWPYQIGRAPDPFCRFGAIQNAAHLMVCKGIGDGQGRFHEEIWRDRGFCAEVAAFLKWSIFQFFI